MVEAYMLSNVVDQGLRTRAVFFDMKGQLNICQTIDLSALKQLFLGQATVLNGLTRMRRCQTTCRRRWFPVGWITRQAQRSLT